MLEFTCPCLNVRIQKSQSLLVIESSNEVTPTPFVQRAPQALDQVVQATPAALGDAFSKNFANSASYFLVKTSLFFAESVGPGSIDSDLSADYIAIKHRQLVGQLAAPNVALYKCVNCNCFTHCVLASAHLKSLKQQLAAAESEAAAAVPPAVQLEYFNENSNMSGSVDSLTLSSSAHLNAAVAAATNNPPSAQLYQSSQSSWQTMSSDTGFVDSSNSNSNPSSDAAAAILHRVVIVSSQMIFDPERMGALRSGPDFSRSFELVLASSCLDQSTIAENNALNLSFSYRADESVERYAERLCQLKGSSQDEDAFKQVFIGLAKAYAGGNTKKSTISSQFNLAASRSESAVVQDEKKLKKKQRKASFRGEPGLVDSVFELEETGDNDLYQKHVRGSGGDDDGYGDDSADEATTTDDAAVVKKSPSAMTSILKKRNSNVGKLADSPPPPEGARQMISLGKKTKSAAMLAKYSFSLPRDIPIMGGHRMMLPLGQVGDSDNDDDGDDDDGNRKEKENEHQDLSFMINDSVNMNDHSDNSDSDSDDELFSSDKRTGAGGEDLSNMGQAISNLASSIVQKDGRELFGGVPSRRIPINSISKSCLD